MTANTQHKNSKTSEQSLSVQARAKAIIDGVFSPEVDTSTVQSRVENALAGDASEAIKLMKEGNFDLFEHLPESMKSDRTVVVSAIKKKAKIYHTLPADIKNNIEVKKAVIESYILSGGSIIEILGIQDLDPKMSGELGAFIAQTYKKNKDNFPDEYSRMLYEIHRGNGEIYKLIIQKNLFVSSGSGISLGAKITEFLGKNSEMLESESPDKVQEKVMSLIQDFLGLQNSQIDENVLKLLTAIGSTIQIVKKKEKKEKSEELGDDEDEYIEETDELEERLTSGPYTYSPIGNKYQVWDPQGSDVKLEKKDFESMGQRSLDNYMNFHQRMKNLGLGFLIDRYSNKIQIATGIDFYAGEGMSDARILIFLNKIGKVLGIPERHYDDKEGNPVVLCFKTLGAAYQNFTQMKESYIGRHSAAYDSMKEKGIIDQNSGDFSIFAFRDVNLDNS